MTTMEDMPEISRAIWETKYRFQPTQLSATYPLDHTINETWWRIARALAEPEDTDQRSLWAQRFYDEH